MKSINIAVACGGTGGHIFPGLAVAKTLQDRGHNVTLWLAGKDIEEEAIADWKGQIITVPSEGFQYGISFRSLLTLWKIIRSIFIAIPLMKKQSPDVVLAMGSYASFAPVISANLLSIPYVIHEANAVPGRVVSVLSKNAAAVAISFEKTRSFINHKRIIHTGMPLRLGLYHNSNNYLSADSNLFTILVLGGSRGADFLNKEIPKAFTKIKTDNKLFKIIHIFGFRPINEIKEVYNKLGIANEVYQFVHNIEDYYKMADLVICRSGASTCAELCLFAKPALLIPYPYAVRDHQMLNASILQDHGAADLIDQNDITPTTLSTYIDNAFNSPNELRRKSASLKNLSIGDSNKLLSNLVEEVC